MTIVARHIHIIVHLIFLFHFTTDHILISFELKTTGDVVQSVFSCANHTPCYSMPCTVTNVLSIIHIFRLFFSSFLSFISSELYSKISHGGMEQSEWERERENEEIPTATATICKSFRLQHTTKRCLSLFHSPSIVRRSP